MSSISAAFHATRTGLQMQEMNLGIKAQNIAAQGVDGYKKQYLVAYDLSYQDQGGVGTTTSEAGTISPTGVQVGSGVYVASVYRMFSQGDPIQTDNPLDLMISGNGFIEVALPDGTVCYTRVGALQKDANGRLVMPKTGYPIVPNITIPPEAESIHISPSGQVSVKISGIEQNLGQIEIATFINPCGLRAMGDSTFVETAASGTPNKGIPGEGSRGTIQQGWREGSNVNAVEEITDLIKIEKIYDMLTKVIKTGESMMESANRTRS